MPRLIKPAGSFLDWSVRQLSSLCAGQHTLLHVDTSHVGSRQIEKAVCEREKKNGADGDLKRKKNGSWKVANSTPSRL